MIVNLEKRLADWLGERAKRKLKEKYPQGITGVLGAIYMTRGKRRGWRALCNNIKKNYYPAAKMMEEDKSVYEVVCQVRMYGHDEFTISLFQEKSDKNKQSPDQTHLNGESITITEYGCVAHPLHRFVLGTSVEIYPQAWYYFHG